MCCFSGPVYQVTNTNIFVRGVGKGRQLLAYGMTLSTANPVAMVLPLPVPAASAEDAVRFIDLKGYAKLFTDLKTLFPEPPTKGADLGLKGPRSAPAPAPLAVVEVGDFEASFVPVLKDFSRLDARFRLSDAVWKSLPHYADWGFAVFKLKAGAKTIHPMAFEFPRRDPNKLFFPTVHVHDGKVHSTAEFDHSLYFQRTDNLPKVPFGWDESSSNAGRFVRANQTKGLVVAADHVYHRVIRGNQKNEDILV